MVKWVSLCWDSLRFSTSPKNDYRDLLRGERESLDNLVHFQRILAQCKNVKELAKSQRCCPVYQWNHRKGLESARNIWNSYWIPNNISNHFQGWRERGGRVYLLDVINVKWINHLTEMIDLQNYPQRHATLPQSKIDSTLSALQICYRCH